MAGVRARVIAVAAALLLPVLGGSLAALSGSAVERDPTLRSPVPTRVVAYGSAPAQRLYLHTVPGRTTAPWILDIHGGYWKYGSGNSVALRALAAHQLRRGFQVFDLDYRLAPAARWPAQLHDVQAATRWIKRHAAELGIDPARGVVAGQSAGGQLAAIAALGGGFMGALDYAGAVDPSAALHAPSARLRGAAEALLGCPPPACPRRWRSADAIPARGRPAPPFLVVQSVGDPTVPAAMAISFVRRLRAAGTPVTFLLRPGRVHACETLGPVVRATDAFLERIVTGGS